MRYGAFRDWLGQNQPRTSRRGADRNKSRQKKHCRKARRLLLESLEDRHLLAAVPQLLADLNPGGDWSYTSQFTEVGDVVFFVGESDYTDATQLWKTDGTVDGTVKVTTIPHEGMYADLRGLVNANGVLAFVLHDRGNPGNPADDRVQLWKSDGTSAGTKLVYDFGLGSTPGGSYLTAVGGSVFGAFTDKGGSLDTGYELFCSNLDETDSAGTYLVKDIRPGPNSSDPSDMLVFGGKLYFAANDGEHGRELWVSDGTPENTEMVSNIKGIPGVADYGSYPTDLTAGDGKFFFGVLNFGVDHNPQEIDDNQVELWQCDGASASWLHTFEVGTSPPGGLDGDPELTYLPGEPGQPGQLFGVVEFDEDEDPTNRAPSRDLVRWNGSDMDHWDLNADGNDWVGNLSPASGSLGFGADDGAHGREPWLTDGDFDNPDGTFMIKDINEHGPSLSTALHLTHNRGAFPAVDGAVYFRAEDGIHGFELWQSDGSESGTELVADINPTSYIDGNSYPLYLTAALGKLFFAANDGEHHFDPWFLDPAAPGLDFGDLDAPYPTLEVDDGARHNIVFGFHLGESVDGEDDGQPSPNADGDGVDEDGVVLLSPLVPGQLATFEVTVTDTGGLGGFLDAWLDVDHDDSFTTTPLEQFLHSEPVEDGVNVVSVMLPVLPSPNDTAVRFRLSSSGGLSPTGLAEDGEVEDYVDLLSTPQMLVDLNPGGEWSRADWFTPVGDVVFFLGFSETGSADLWKTDGTVGGTVKVTTVMHENPTTHVEVGGLVNANGILAFSVFDYNGTWREPADDRVQLWKSDGTSAGTVLVWDFGLGSTGPMTHGAYLTAVGGSVFGVLRTGAGDLEEDTGYELFYSDLNEANPGGTYLVKDIRPGAADSYPTSLLAFDGKLYFAANDGVHGKELWVSDGTPGGTQMVENIKGIPDVADFGSFPTDLTAADGMFYFGVLDPGPDYNPATIGDNHVELWQSDGTGAALVYTFEDGTMPPGGTYSFYGDPELTYLAETGQLFGVVEFDDAGERSQDLVCWDGTNMQHWNLNEGGNDWVGNLSPAFDKLGFGADDGVHGREPWQTDGGYQGAVGALAIGNPAGTFMIKDINGGESSSLDEPWGGAFPAVDGAVFFPADDDVHGKELWRSDGTAHGTKLVADLNSVGEYGNSYLSNLTAALGKLFFVADDGEHGRDPWVYPGTPELDFGDLGDPYPTLAVDGGPGHAIQPGFHLGETVDADPDGQPDPNASGDDNSETDDEDGVVFVTPLRAGELASIEVVLTDNSELGGVLDAWLDWNQDGDWDDAGERVFAGQELQAGVNELTGAIHVPGAAMFGSTAARFRLSREGVETPGGGAPDGEVEDYWVVVEPAVESDLSDDIVGRNQYGYLWVAKSNGTNAFTSGIWGQWSTARTWTDVLAGDFNGDGHDDVVGRNEFGYWWVAASNGSTGFTSSIWGKWDPTRTWTNVMVGDFNDDGYDDLVGRNQFGYWWVAASNGTGAFSSAIWGKWDTARTWTNVMVGDFNADGCDDLVARNEYGYWWVAASDGSDGFTSSIWGKWDPARTWSDVMVGDFNADGADDLVGRNQFGYWWVAASDGSGVFSNAIWGQWSTARTWTDVMVGDFDGNGADDVVGRNDYGYWWVAKSNGAGVFSNGIWGKWDNTRNWVDVMVGDFNRDGDDDVVGRDKFNYWWVQKSNGWDKFANEYWGKWNAVDWFDVLGGNFGD